MNRDPLRCLADARRAGSWRSTSRSSASSQPQAVGRMRARRMSASQRNTRDGSRPSAISPRQFVGQPQPPLGLGQHHHPAVRSDPAAVEGSCHFLAAYGWKTQRATPYRRACGCGASVLRALLEIHRTGLPPGKPAAGAMPECRESTVWAAKRSNPLPAPAFSKRALSKEDVSITKSYAASGFYATSANHFRDSRE